MQHCQPQASRCGLGECTLKKLRREAHVAVEEPVPLAGEDERLNQCRLTGCTAARPPQREADVLLPVWPEEVLLRRLVQLLSERNAIPSAAHWLSQRFQR